MISGNFTYLFKFKYKKTLQKCKIEIQYQHIIKRYVFQYKSTNVLRRKHVKKLI